MLGGPGAAGAFARAISADPDFALAHIVRSRVHSFYQQGGDAARKQAGIAAEKISRDGKLAAPRHAICVGAPQRAREPRSTANPSCRLRSTAGHAIVDFEITPQNDAI
jgi:hypothetical protein